jgi:hypothetical protein
MAVAAAEAPKFVRSTIPTPDQSEQSYLYLEDLAEQPVLERKEQRSFDPQASCNMLRYDLDTVGYILPETRAQVCDEQLSYLVEGIGRAARTPFVLKRQGDQLSYFTRGQWRPYMGMLATGLQVAEREAKQDSRRNFLATWATNDMQHGYAMNALQPGQRRSWYSSYAHKEAALYGEEFINSCGLVSDRKMGFLYQAICLEDGSVLLESQTIDGSDQEGFAAAIAVAEQDPLADLDDLTLAYDNVLIRKYGGNFSAGRRPELIEQDTWQFIKQQRDLIEYHLDKLGNIAALDLPPNELERVTKEHLYGVWAAFKKRLDGTAPHQSASSASQQCTKEGQPTIYRAISSPNIAQEVDCAFQEFVSQGRVLVGCGGSIKILEDERDVMNASAQEVFSSIFGSTKCPEIKDGQITNCPHCKKRVKAIVPDRETIFCSNDECKLAAPGLRKAYRLRSSQTRQGRVSYI